MLENTGEYRRVQCCSAVQCSAVQFSAMQCSAVQCSAAHCAVQCSATHCAVQCSAVQCWRVPGLIRPSLASRGFLHSTVSNNCTVLLHITAQCYSTSLHSTTPRHCTVLLHITAQCTVFPYTTAQCTIVFHTTVQCSFTPFNSSEVRYHTTRNYCTVHSCCTL